MKAITENHKWNSSEITDLIHLQHSSCIYSLGNIKEDGEVGIVRAKIPGVGLLLVVQCRVVIPETIYIAPVKTDSESFKCVCTMCTRIYLKIMHIHICMCKNNKEKEAINLRKGAMEGTQRRLTGKVRERKRSKESIASLLCGGTFSLEPPAAKNGMETYY